MIRLPSLALMSTRGRLVDLSAERGRAIVFVYPFTGTPEQPDPANWDNIPGAHGSTPEALGFAKAWPEFMSADIAIYGLSGQTPAEQLAFSQRNALPFELLSDQAFAFADALNLERFATGGTSYLKRQTFILHNGEIAAHIPDVPNPAHHAAEMLERLVSA